MKKIAKAACLAALITTGASAQQDQPPSRTDLAYAAGYKAQFLCSGLFNGGKSFDAIAADELTGIYARIADIVPKLDGDIDLNNKNVSVVFADDMPPRRAQWNPRTGCTSMPIGWTDTGNKAAALPDWRRLAPDALQEESWPMGDARVRRDGPAALSRTERVMSPAFTEKAYGGVTKAALVVRGKEIVGELYAKGYDYTTGQRTWSVAKSIAGTLIGHNVHLGNVTPEAKAQINAWQAKDDPRRTITLDNLMRMSSGLVSDSAGNRTDAVYMGGMAVRERAPHWPMLHAPGTTFRYANNDTLLAYMATRNMAVQSAKTPLYNTPLSAIYPAAFFDKLGMTRTFAETDWQGDYIISSQVWTTSRDLARLGMLYLNDGIWPYGKDGPERLLPEGWRDYVSAPNGPQPEGAFGYGATFWLMSKSDGVPADTFAAFGNRGQYLVIIPSRNLVIVRRGYDTRADRFDIAAFTRDIVAAVPR